MTARDQEAMRILDSSRNRLRPYFDSDILRRMFGSTQNRLDVLRMMREGRIVIVDLSPRNRLGEQLANTIGAHSSSTKSSRRSGVSREMFCIRRTCFLTSFRTSSAPISNRLYRNSGTLDYG